MVDLNTLIPANSGWTLTEAHGINNLGQIAGSGAINREGHAFLLTPVPEPTGLCLGAALGFGMLAARRRRAGLKDQ